MPHFARQFVVALAAVVCAALPAAAQNVVQLENMKPGSTDWQIFSAATNHEIEGYASATSVNRGETIRLYVSTIDPTYTINIYRMGWYGGAGARKVLGPITRTGMTQPVPAPDPVTGLVECNWADPYVLTIPNTSDPTDWASGFYLAKLTAPASREDNYIIFVVRDDARISTHYFQSSVTTYQAYNNWGGKSLYNFNSTGGSARKVSFNRPYQDGTGTGDFLYRFEYNMVRFLEREGYDVTYSTDVDTHQRGALLKNHRDFLSVGHDEYWTWEMRTNVTAARDAGVNLAFFSANTCYWQMRFEPSVIDPTQLDRTEVSYKEYFAEDPYYTDSDPANDNRVTTKWRNSPVNDSEDALIGVMYVADPVDADIVIDDVTSAPWVFDNTGLAHGSVLPGLLGYEVDKMAIRTPPGTIRLGHSWFTTKRTSGAPNTSDYSDMSLYTAPSGALVFATGSIQWSWGLDSWHPSNRSDRTNAAAQQMTRNILHRFAGPDASKDCQYALSPATFAAPSLSGSGSVDVTTHCAWSASSDVAWLTITSAASGDQSATITYAFAANPGPARTGHVTVGDRVHTVVQESGCGYTLTPGGANVGAAGGTQTFSVTPNDAGCTWTAVPTTTWLSVASSTGRGPGTVTYTAAPNSGPSRSGGISVNGVVFSVTQASGCTYAVSPPSLSANADGGSYSVSVTTDPRCHWSSSVSSSSSSWITIASGATGVGSGSATFTIAPNSTGSVRNGTVGVAGRSIPVNQSANPAQAGAKLYLVTPCRVIDTRAANGPYGGPSLAPRGVRTVMAAGACGIPSTATSIVANVTAVGAASNGWLTVYPAGVALPPTSTVNYRAGKTRANNAIISLSPDGRLNVYNSGPDAIHFLIDVTGFMQ